MNAQQRIDAWTLVLHERVAQRLPHHPDWVARLKARVDAQLALDGGGRSATLLRTWREWLELPTEQLAARMCERSDRADELRSVSPIAVVVSQHERRRVMQEAQIV
jgi:hypothetical protein